ncbi:MAG TPA: phosphatase PAP2 family protein [Kofleriaceae bacterium]
MTRDIHRLLPATALAVCVAAGRTWAQPAPPDGQAPGADTPSIPQAQGASPEAKRPEEPARAAQLTPIVPHPNDRTPSAFQLYAELDLPILTVGLVYVSVRFVRNQKAFCAPQCDRNDLNALDRTTAGFWSPNWLLASNVGLVTLGAGAFALLSADEGALEALNDSVVVAEAALSATAVASIMTIAAGRPRPFLYGDKAPLADRNGSDAANSFLSSHAAVGFAIATSTYVAMHRLHPTSAFQYGVLGVGLGAAAFVATSRVMAGQHFITDALGGALVGSSVGVLVASAHGLPLTVIPVAGEHHRGLGIQGAF